MRAGKRVRSEAVSRGFTLIEILVVVAIIGMLASIILASLSGARAKGKDSAIKEDLHSLQTQADLLRTDTCYPGPNACAGGGQTVTTLSANGGNGCNPSGGNLNLLCSQPAIYNILVTAVQASGGAFVYQNPAGAAAYAVAVQLVSDPALAWCVDSSGTAKVEGTAGGTPLTSSTIAAATVTSGHCI